MRSRSNFRSMTISAITTSAQPPRHRDCRTKMAVQIYHAAGACLTSGASVADVAAWLKAAAGATRNPHLRRAAAALERSSGGRPTIDDDAALAELKWLIRTGRA